MPLSSIVTNFYYEVGAPAISAELSELSQGYPTSPPPSISAELSELLDSIPTNGISAEMQGTVPELLVLLGVDLSTGMSKTFSPGDSLVRSNGAPYLGNTGLRGFTGLRGATGAQGVQGETGLFTGITGIRGITGVTLGGTTGLQGDTGIAGLTGLQPVRGATGLSVTGIVGIIGSQVSGNTGIIGITGLVGITGLSIAGDTGLQGDTGVIGQTGVHGLTGFAPLGISPQGDTGILAGDTGIAGVSGSTGISGVETVFTLNAQRSTTASSLSYTVSANTIDTNEQQLEVIAWGISSSAGVATTVALTFGGATILNQSISGAAGNLFLVRSIIIRVTSSSQENNSYLISKNGETYAQKNSTAVDFTSAQTLQISVQAAEGQQFVYGFLVRKVAQI